MIVRIEDYLLEVHLQNPYLIPEAPEHHSQLGEHDDYLSRGLFLESPGNFSGP